jgi:Arc/MetJ-type ribon-helix-helix transcriptional regulator
MTTTKIKKNVGKPPLSDEPPVRVSVRLSDANIERMQKIGGFFLGKSEIIRIAVEQLLTREITSVPHSTGRIPALVVLTPDQAAKLKEIAAKFGTSVSSLVRYALTSYNDK